MKNLYKKICVVVLSSVVLAGGALVSNSSVSSAYSVESIVSQSNYYCKRISKNHKEDIISIFKDGWELYDFLIEGVLGPGVYQVGNELFFISC